MNNINARAANALSADAVENELVVWIFAYAPQHVVIISHHQIARAYAASMHTHTQPLGLVCVCAVAGGRRFVGRTMECGCSGTESKMAGKQFVCGM